MPLICACILRAAQLFGGSFLPDRRLHQRGAGEKQAAALGHQNVVAHHRQIRAARDAHPHDGGDLRNAHGAHHGVVAEDAAEIVGIGKTSSCSGRNTPAESTR